MHKPAASPESILRDMGIAEDDRRASALAELVKGRREELGVTQSELALKAGLSRSTIAAVEGAKYGNPDTSTLKALARALNLPQLVVAEMMLERGSTATLVTEFESSPWFSAVSPTAVELEWVRALPDVLWEGTKATPEDVADIIRWRRKSTKDAK